MAKLETAAVRSALQAVNDDLVIKIEAEGVVIVSSMTIEQTAELVSALKSLPSMIQQRQVTTAPSFPLELSPIGIEDIISRFPVYQSEVFVAQVMRSDEGIVNVFRVDGGGFSAAEAAEILAAADSILA